MQETGGGRAYPEPGPTGRDDRCEEAPVSPSKWHEVVIRKVANGFIVIVGCQTLVAKDWAEVVIGLADYWNDPRNAEKKYCQGNN